MVFPHFTLSGWVAIFSFILIAITLDRPLSELFDRLCGKKDKLSTFLVWLTAFLLSYILYRLVYPGIANFAEQIK